MFSVGSVGLHVCLSVCLSLSLSVPAVIFELLYTRTSFLVCWYIFTISRSRLSINDIGLRSMSYAMSLLSLSMWLQVTNKVKVTHQGQGQHQDQVQMKIISQERYYYVCRWFAFDSDTHVFFFIIRLGEEPKPQHDSFQKPPEQFPMSDLASQ